MNCKPGDIAYIAMSGEHYGEVVRVLKRDNVDPAMWLYEGAVICLRTGTRYEALNDSVLRPIRDPGEDARDETLSWLDVPTTERTTEAA